MATEGRSPTRRLLLGALGGALGSGVMALSSLLEKRLRQAPRSRESYEAAMVGSLLLRGSPSADGIPPQITLAVHVGYGALWGSILALAPRGPLSPVGMILGIANWGAALTALPLFDIDAPRARPAAAAVAWDFTQHIVYVAATAGATALLGTITDRRRNG